MNLHQQAGLFSAILTAFNVQSYPLLTPAPPDPILAALQQISIQLSNHSVSSGSSSVNASHPAFDLQPSPSPPAERWTVWLNVVWFASLIFSLSAASVGIMVKQWLNLYSSGLSGSSQDIARLRQHRLNSLQKWCVGGIVAILPVLLQVGGVLFFSGLLILLWALNRTVAIISSTLVGVLTLFLFATIIIPAFTSDCPYLSPASFAVCETLRPVFLSWFRLQEWFISRYSRFWLPPATYTDPPRQRHPLMSLLVRILRTLCSYPGDVSFCLPIRGRESRVVTAGYGAQLDGDMVAAAYAVATDSNYLDLAAICITRVNPRVAVLCFDKIRTQEMRHGGYKPYHPCMWSGVIAALLCCRWPDPLALGAHRFWSLASLKTVIEYLTESYAPFGRTFDTSSDSAWTRLSCFDYLHAIRSGNSDLMIDQRTGKTSLPSLLLTHLISWVEQHRWLSGSDRNLCSSSTPYSFLASHSIQLTVNKLTQSSVAAGMADVSSPSGPCTGWDDRSTALCCLLEVIPHPNSPAYDEETFQAIVRHANRAFLNFASALSKFEFTNEGDNDSEDPVLRAVLQVCLRLERFEMEYWKVAGFPHPQFTKAVHDYFCIWERRQSTERFVDIIWASQIEGVRKLINAYRCGEDRQQVRAPQGPLLPCSIDIVLFRPGRRTRRTISRPRT